MEYDITSKVILTRCKEGILRHLCGLEVEEAELLETRPQETASLRRSDFVLRVQMGGEERLVLLEFQTRWRSWLPLRTLECRCRHGLEEGLPVVTVILLLRPSSAARDFYRDEEVEYRYRLVRVYEWSAREVLERRLGCLYPFVPLMKGGLEHVEEAEEGLYRLPEPVEVRADLLNGLAVLGGLISPEIPVKLLERRRDIMIESAAYEVFRKEFMNEGYEKGLEEGLQRGLIEEAREMVLEALQERFGVLEGSLVEQVESIRSRELLKGLHRMAIRCADLEEFREALRRALS